MKTEAKNKGGRPSRVPGERLKRVALNLRPIFYFGLELLARDRGSSLSQAVEYALAIVLRDYEMDGSGALKIAEQATTSRGLPAEMAPETLVVDLDYLKEEGLERSKVYRLTCIPERLRTPEEKYVLEICKGLPVVSRRAEDAYEKAVHGYRLGLTKEQVLAELQTPLNRPAE